VEDDEFWAYVARLGGVADDTTCRPLHDVLVRDGRGPEFGAAVDEHVRRLLGACKVPFTHQGDTAEWIAAAVIAAGRPTYEKTLAAGKKLRPADWAWDAAEALLVAGSVDDHTISGPAQPEATLSASLQWNARPAPEGVTTSWEPFADAIASMMGPLDHPSAGRSVCDDPEWDAALELAGADTGILVWARNAGLHLTLVVRDVPTGEYRRFAEQGQVMRVVPLAEALAAQPRRDLYLAELRALAEWA
jgi:hypothetical protein